MASVLDKRLILVTGKGGVGRSTVAAAIAAACARRGRRTLLFQASAKDRFGSFFGTTPVGTTITRLDNNLHAVNTNPAAALEEYGLMVLRFRRVYQMVFENRVAKYFLRAIPGLDDYSILGKAWYHTTEEDRGRPAWDTLVFDMPASGHSLTMLRIPKVILETVPEGPLTRDARLVWELLRDTRRTATVLVTLPEEMPANEARELSGQLDRDLGIQIAHLVINQVYPDHFPAGSPQDAVLDALLRQQTSGPAKATPAGAPAPDRDGPRNPDRPADPQLAALVAHAELQRSRRRLGETFLRELADSVAAPHSELPFVFAPSLGKSELASLSRLVEEQLSS